ncbi:MAG: two-component sensor histidine kinase [Planctomycetaceae bacterium]|nr:two-component sensor histidine kinase [Planctomycetaceae bacterium]
MADPQLTPQQEIAILKQQLAAAQRMAALGELTGTTTHEFNNVLTTIVNYAKLGLRHKDEPTRDKALDRILKAAQRAERITNSVLGMARNRKEEFAPTDVAKLIEESLVLLEREMTKYRVAVTKDFADAPPVRAIGNQIQQVLLNLMTNARQAMANGGQLTLRIAHDAQAGLVDLTIRDTGPGIPRDKLPRIFDRYYTTKSGPDATGKGGSGVGLSTCRDIVEAHQGRLRVESAVGKGTAFTIRLPVWVESESSVTQPHAPVAKLGVPTA